MSSRSRSLQRSLLEKSLNLTPMTVLRWREGKTREIKVLLHENVISGTVQRKFVFSHARAPASFCWHELACSSCKLQQNILDALQITKSYSNSGTWHARSSTMCNKSRFGANQLRMCTDSAFHRPRVLRKFWSLLHNVQQFSLKISVSRWTSARWEGSWKAALTDKNNIWTLEGWVIKWSLVYLRVTRISTVFVQINFRTFSISKFSHHFDSQTLQTNH